MFQQENNYLSVEILIKFEFADIADITVHHGSRNSVLNSLSFIKAENGQETKLPNKKKKHFIIVFNQA